MIRELSIPNEWMNAVHSLENEKGLAIILGMHDTGKSTFAKYLTSNLTAKKIKVGLVDADIGQSFLGPHIETESIRNTLKTRKLED